MIEGEALVLPPEAAGAAKAYLRVERSDEDALIAGLVLAATELCEAFTGQALVEREFAEILPADRAWRRLGRSPVRAIDGVEALAADGMAEALAVGAYGVDIDPDGDGWVHTAAAGETRRIRIRYRAGLAGAWADLPAAPREGILRLAGHFYTSRTADGGRAGEPPAAVAALWRPFRRIRLDRGRRGCSRG